MNNLVKALELLKAGVKETDERIANLLNSLSENYTEEKEPESRIPEILSAYQAVVEKTLSTSDKIAMAEHLLIVKAGWISDLKFPLKENILIRGKSRIGKTFFLQTLRQYIEEKRKENLRQQNKIAGSDMPDSERLEKNRELHKFEKSSRFIYLTESEVSMKARNPDNIEFYKLKERIRDCSFLMLDELFFSPNWSFTGNIGSTFLLNIFEFWSLLCELNATDKIKIIGTTNYDYNAVIPEAIGQTLKNRIAEIFRTEIFLAGK